MEIMWLALVFLLSFVGMNIGSTFAIKPAWRRPDYYDRFVRLSYLPNCFISAILGLGATYLIVTQLMNVQINMSGSQLEVINGSWPLAFAAGAISLVLSGLVAFIFGRLLYGIGDRIGYTS